MSDKERVVWSTPSEDYKGQSDTSSLVLDKDRVTATCNDWSKVYQVQKTAFGPTGWSSPDYALDPADRELVSELCEKAFGVLVCGS